MSPSPSVTPAYHLVIRSASAPCHLLIRSASAPRHLRTRRRCHIGHTRPAAGVCAPITRRCLPARHGRHAASHRRCATPRVPVSASVGSFPRASRVTRVDVSRFPVHGHVTCNTRPCLSVPVPGPLMTSLWRSGPSPMSIMHAKTPAQLSPVSDRKPVQHLKARDCPLPRGSQGTAQLSSRNHPRTRAAICPRQPRQLHGRSRPHSP